MVLPNKDPATKWAYAYNLRLIEFIKLANEGGLYGHAKAMADQLVNVLESMHVDITTRGNLKSVKELWEILQELKAEID